MVPLAIFSVLLLYGKDKQIGNPVRGKVTRVPISE